MKLPGLILSTLLLAGCVGLPQFPTPSVSQSTVLAASDVETPAQLEEVLTRKLGKSNRDGVERLESVKLAKNRLTIRWAINDNLSADLRNRGMRNDAAVILESVSASMIDWDVTALQGTFAMVDVKGNESEDVVARASYSFESLLDVNWDNFDSDNVWKIADTALVHHEFR